MGPSKDRRDLIIQRVRDLVESNSLDTWSRQHDRRASKLKRAIKYGRPSWFEGYTADASYHLCQREISRKYRAEQGIITAPPGRPKIALTDYNMRCISKITHSHPTYSLNQVTARLLSRVRIIYVLVISI